MGLALTPDRSHRITRRLLIAGGAGSLALMSVPSLAAVSPRVPRSLKFHNLHTGETFASPYWADGAYLPDALQHIAKVLRDHRNDAVHPIAPNLLDLLHRLHARLDAKTGFQVISGYRSPESNAKLAARSNGVATHSLHMDGKAIDIRIAGVPLPDLHKAARELKGGGVGYYAASDFVHMDVGRVRSW